MHEGRVKDWLPVFSINQHQQPSNLHMQKNTFLLLCFILLLSACSNHTYDDVSIDEDQQQPELVTYLDVKPIIQNACLQCHGNPPQNAAPMPLDTYQSLRDAVLTRGLIERISLPETNGALMPLGGPRLPQASIDLIVAWESDGLMEN